MINDEELKKAEELLVEWESKGVLSISTKYYKAIEKMREVVKALLNRPAGWPEKSEPCIVEEGDPWDSGYEVGKAEGRDQAIDECTSAREKEKQAGDVTVEEITPLLVQYIGEWTERNFDAKHRDCSDITRKFGEAIKALLDAKRGGK